jgi:hypothetical protein
MAYPDDPGEILVSLQNTTADADALTGHIALGAFIGSNLTIFQLSVGQGLSDGARLEVLISPTEPGRDDVIERIRPLQVLIRSLTNSPGSGIALVPLAQASRYGSASRTRTRSELQAELQRSGDIWSALRQLGMVDRSLHEIDASRALRQIAELETVQRLRVVHEQRGLSAEELADCPFSNNCFTGPLLVDS